MTQTLMPQNRGTLVFWDDFSRGIIDESKWVAGYLPHWTTPELAAPHHHFGNGHLVLKIDTDQPPWCPSHDGDIKCSSIQTGHHSGSVGSSVGQLRFNKNLRVVTALPTIQKYVPLHGYFEVRAKANISTNNMVAFWMVGFEAEPDDSGEITIMEIFGRNCSPTSTTLGYGVKQSTDPRLPTEYHEDVLPFSLSDWHTYGAEWDEAGVTHYLDNKPLRHIKRAPHYPLQFMLGIYELPEDPKPETKQIATFTIDYVRGYDLNSQLRTD